MKGKTKMQINNLPQEVATDLIEFLNNIEVKRDKSVNYGKVKFEYASLDNVLSKIKKNKKFTVLEPLGSNDKGEPALQVILIHKSGYVICSDYYNLRLPQGKTKQDEGAAITYTRRYALASMLGISIDEDTDANLNGKKMKVETEDEVDYRRVLIELLKERKIDYGDFAAKNNLVKGKTNKDTFKKLVEQLKSEE